MNNINLYHTCRTLQRKIKIRSIANARKERKEYSKDLLEKSNELSALNHVGRGKFSYLSSKIKNFEKKKARHMYIAYGLLKGKKYREIEKTCSDMPDLDLVFKCIHEMPLSFHERKEWTIEKVKEVLDE